jgi:hypothetical protein
MWTCVGMGARVCVCVCVCVLPGIVEHSLEGAFPCPELVGSAAHLSVFPPPPPQAFLFLLLLVLRFELRVYTLSHSTSSFS